MLAAGGRPTGKRGHKVFTPTLTGLGERVHLLTPAVDLDTHVTDVVNLIKYEGLQNICLLYTSPSPRD